MTRLLDRSRITKYWYCPRARFWQYEYKSKGIVKSTTSLPLYTGTCIHDSLATIATFHKEGVEVPIDEIAKLAFDTMKQELMEASEGEVGAHEFASEQACLVEGLIRGFFKHSWPILMDTYPKIIAIESEMTYDLGDDVKFMAKPDLIVEDKEGELVYIEYKSTSSKKQEWVDSWNTAVQLHSSIKACEQSLGRTPGYVQILGLYKGYVSYGKQSSPLVYGYKRSGNPPFTQDDIKYEYKAGYKRSPVWEMDGGVKAWIESMPPDVLANQFPLSPQIFVDQDLVDAFFRQTKVKEAEIEIASRLINESPEDNQGLLDKTFPQHYEKCSPAWGFKCEYMKLCHGHVEDPLNEGFQVREAHHSPEMEQFNDS